MHVKQNLHADQTNPYDSSRRTLVHLQSIFLGPPLTEQQVLGEDTATVLNLCNELFCYCR